MVGRPEIEHDPVLADRAVELLAVRRGLTVVDATLGHGGHAVRFASILGKEGRLIGLDVDPENLTRARDRLEAARTDDWPTLHLFRANFADIPQVLKAIEVPQVHVLLADLGLSTDQMLDSSRGLSFLEDGPLDMRLDPDLPTTAADLVNRLSESELADLLYHNAQERYSRRIARRICQARHRARIRRSGELVAIVTAALAGTPRSPKIKIHPATRTFLALRMAVNRELENLQSFLAIAPKTLYSQGRVGVLTFHSGEDRIVKQDFLDRRRAGIYELVTPKPVQPLRDELDRNPRARSAKFRVAARTQLPLPADA